MTTGPYALNQMETVLVIIMFTDFPQTFGSARGGKSEHVLQTSLINSLWELYDVLVLLVLSYFILFQKQYSVLSYIATESVSFLSLSKSN